eukprot:16713-Heterococcus_DN1.PRE.2
MSNLNEAWEIFKQGVGSVLRQWTALRLAIVSCMLQPLEVLLGCETLLLNMHINGCTSRCACFAATTLQENNWGGGDSNRKAANLEAELIDMFRTKKQLYRDDVEDYLNAYLDDNFGTYAEDG